MSPRLAAVVVAGTTLVAAIATAIASSRLSDARNDADTARRRVRSVSLDAAEALALRASAARTVVAPDAAADITPRLTAALAEAWVPRDRLREVAPHGAAGDGARQSVRIILEPVSLPDLGRTLASLRADQHAWSPFQIEITGEHAGALCATIVLTAARR